MHESPRMLASTSLSLFCYYAVMELKLLEFASEDGFSGGANSVPAPLCCESVTCRFSARVDVHVQVMGVIHGNNFRSKKPTAKLS